MADIRDYIQWRGDLDFSKSEFNEIDNLVFSRFSYFPFDRIIKENETALISELGNRFEKAKYKEGEILQKEDIDFFPLMAKSERYGKLFATKFVNRIDVKEEKQFSAITVILPNDTIFISYRGTDNTLIGWKEDFNLSFKTHIASQKDAVEYLREVADEYKDKKLILGGHSKGGNLAMYSAIFAPSQIKDRIIAVYNNDGPGFFEEITKLDEFKEILPKIHTYIPQSSIVGRLLDHVEEYTIVESTQKGIMQHDIFSWQVIGNKLIKLDTITDDSKFVDSTITKWLASVDQTQREKFVDVLFEILSTTDAEILPQLKEKWFTNAKLMLTTYKNIDEENKVMINQTLQSLFKIAKDNIFNKEK